MRMALITTTINVPTVLKLYRAFGPDVAFFVAGDERTPPETAKLVYDIGSRTVAQYISPVHQRELGYECSALIGWNCIQRRNIALLEALKWGAEIIVSIDDDNVPMDVAYFANFYSVLENPFSGLSAGSGWFDVGQLMFPRDGIDPVSQRGIPQSVLSIPKIESLVNVRVGVAQGIALGDPDISAVDRISRKYPEVHQVSAILRAGIVTDPDITLTVFNSQNTAFLRELAPAMFMYPGLGRYDDIYASLICQHIMCERALHVHFGHPFVWQERNHHNLINDLKAEMFGMEHVRDFAAFLSALTLQPDPVVHQVRMILSELSLAPRAFFPADSIKAGFAWCNDVEKVL